MTRQTNLLNVVLSLLLLIVSGTFSLAAQTDRRAAEVLDNAYQHYERSIANIDDYVLETDLYTTYYKKAYDNGRPYFKSRTEYSGIGGVETVSNVSDAELFSPESFEKMKRTAKYEGTERVDGYRTHVIFIPELESFIDEDEDELDDTMQNVRFYFDADNYVLRKMKFSIETEADDGRQIKVEPLVRMKDYRNIEGMQIPFQTLIIVEGLSGHMSEAERREAREGLKEMERELENMPAEQKRMMEEMMGGQLDQLRKMLEEDRMEMNIQVKNVRVNTGMEDFD